jgi:hypothetical protein
MCNCELVLVKFSLCWDGRILHFICDGAKEFLFVKRMPKRFESEFNMLASMFHDHLLLDFFPSNAFMASARSLHMFNRSKKMNCNYHARLSTCR